MIIKCMSYQNFTGVVFLQNKLVTLEAVEPFIGPTEAES